MPSFKRLKKLPKLDMNPMVDMAFLLVSFFMMTTTFKTESPEETVLPYTRSEIKLPEKNVCTITIGEQGNLYLGIDNKFDRAKMLSIIERQNELSFNDAQRAHFSLLSSFGLPLDELESFLALSMAEEKAYNQTGIPLDSANNEFRQWVIAARLANPRLRFAINADKAVLFPVVQDCFETLRDLNITRFNLITESKTDDTES